MGSTLTTFDAFLKENYGDKKRVQDLIYREFPFLGWINKKHDVANTTGDTLVAPIMYGTPQSMSSSLTYAQTVSGTAGGATQAKKWTCTYGDYFSSLTISDKLMKLSASDMGSFLEARKTEIDNLYKAWSETFSTYLLTTKARNLGSFTISTGVCTLTNAEDAVNYHAGMVLEVSADDGSATGHALLTSNLGYIIGVNANAGTFTVSATDGGAAGTPTSWTGTMFAFRYGDFGGTTTPNSVCFGLGDWCPAADPGATAFNGVNRTADIVALSGVRLTSAEIAGLSTEQRIKKLATRMGRIGRAPEAIFVNPEKWQDLADALESRGVRTAFGKDATFGYNTITLAAGGREVPVYSDPFVPVGTIYALRKDAFTLYAPQDFPFILNGDGLDMLRKATANDYEIRLQAYPCTLATPGWLGRTTAA